MPLQKGSSAFMVSFSGPFLARAAVFPPASARARRGPPPRVRRPAGTARGSTPPRAGGPGPATPPRAPAHAVARAPDRRPLRAPGGDTVGTQCWRGTAPSRAGTHAHRSLKSARSRGSGVGQVVAASAPPGRLADGRQVAGWWPARSRARPRTAADGRGPRPPGARGATTPSGRPHRSPRRPRSAPVPPPISPRSAPDPHCSECRLSPPANGPPGRSAHPNRAVGM